MSNMAKKYEIALAEATCYEDWYDAALALDQIEGGEKWREVAESPDYDYKLLASRTKLLSQLRRRKDVDRLIFRLREELHGNLGNMANPALYQHSRIGTKKLITNYIDEVCASLNLLCDSDVQALPPMRKRIFLKRAARSFGRSALLLSGGASLGLFHIGVLRELEAQGILPRVITGSSAGSIVAGILCTHTNEEWERLMQRDDWRFEWAQLVKLTDLTGSRGLLDQKVLQRCIEQNMPDMTFLEAYQHTNRILNISVSPADSHQFPRLLNYLTAPNVLIRRAALASAAIPAVFPPGFIKVSANGSTYEEMHVDGGATREVFLVPTQFMASKADRKLGFNPIRRAYIIRNGRVTPEKQAVKVSALSIGPRSISTLMKEQGIGDLYELYELCRVNGINYNLAYIPGSFNATSAGGFDPTYMTALYNEGFRIGRSGAWKKKPPSFE